ncbi:conjugal transfer protein TraH [Acidithiobacillus sp.]|uniref:conjugal transfer protein TraH n=1 Tax=Acidithiobacillus sp. TaxID=1872118 RepID=UPI003D016197
MLRQDTPTLRFLVKGVLLAVGASLVTTTAMHEQDAYALGMQSFVQGMFSATSSPVLANTGNGYTLTGGYAEIRTPLSGANIISFSPPDISAGCGGINLYMGSFHFVNGQEFLALLRTVGQEALGYAFQLAIDAMCHQCGALLASIQKAITAMNNALHNTCQLAQGIYPANKIIGDFAQVGHQAEKTMAANEGDFSDFFGSSDEANHEGVLSHIADTFENNISESINGTTVTKKEPQSAMTPIGNMFWKAIDNSQAYQLLSNIEAGTTTNSVDTKEILMSMAGTEIARPSAGQSGNAAESSMQYQSTNSTPNAANSKNTQTVDPNLFLQELVNGTATAPVDTCQTWTSANGHTYSATSGEMSCEQVDVGGTTLGQLGYEGIGKHIDHMMYGGGPGNHTGLVKEMIEGNGLSSAQQAFSGTIPAGILSLMHEAEPNTNLVTTIAEKVKPILVDEYAVKLGEAIMTAESSVYNGNSHVVVPGNYSVAMADLGRAVNTYSVKEALHENVMNELTTMVRDYRASLAQSGAGPQ